MITEQISADNKQVISDQPSTCLNCQQPLTDQYCSHCGQCSDLHLQGFSTVFRQLLDDIFSFDSRASRTIWPLMFKPGFLTEQFFKGRIVHYVPPIRLYLFISVIFFIALQFFTLNGQGEFGYQQNDKYLEKINLYSAKLEQQKNTADPQTQLNIAAQLAKFDRYKADITAQNTSFRVKMLIRELVDLELTLSEVDKTKQAGIEIKRSSVLKQLEQARQDKDSGVISISNNQDGSFTFDFLSAENNQKLSAYIDNIERKAQQTINSDPSLLFKQSLEKLPPLMFILLPVFALLLKLFYLFSDRLYLEHLTVALHSHSFIFIMLLMVQLLDFSQSKLDILLPNFADFLALAQQLLLLWLPIYLFIMQKRVYRQGYFMTWIKFSILGIFYILLLTWTSLIALLWGVSSI